MNKFFSLPIFTSAVVIFACSCSDKPAGMMPTSYNTITITTDSFTVNNEYTASLQGVQCVEIRPQVTGFITDIRVNEGATVKKGEVMFVLDQVAYKAALANAEAKVKTAQAELANMQLTYKAKSQLYEKGIVSDYEEQQTKNNLDAAQASLANAEASLLNAKNDLSYTEVKSPVNGVIGMIQYRIGALVNSGITEPLTIVSDNSTVHAYFSISESQLQSVLNTYGSISKIISEYPPVKLILSDGSEYAHTGTIDAISGNIDSATGAVRIRATFPNPDSVLRNGGSATIVIPYSFSGIIIPQEATFELQEKTFVYKIIDGKTKSVEISVAEINDGSKYAVTSGINVGDVIIAEGVGLLHDGIEVSVSKQEDKK